MRLKDLKKIKLPDTPGVYFFVASNEKILYIGKATSLRDRVRSYFSRDIVKTRGPRIKQMLEQAQGVNTTSTDSVLEALILEANLIKKHKPLYNAREKDDKSFNYVIFTKEDFPRVLVVRGKDLVEKKFKASEIKYQFGPFPHGLVFKEAMKIIRKIFPFYDTKYPVLEMKSRAQRGKLSFNRQLGIYPQELSKQDYARTIRHLKLFFDGKKKVLLTQLRQEMKMYAARQEFEKAVEIKRKIFALTHIQDVALIKEEFRQPVMFRNPPAGGFRIEAYDVAHLSGTNMVGVMIVVEHGEVQKGEYRKFRIRGVSHADDTKALGEMLERRFTHDEWVLPSLVVVDGGTAQVNAAKNVLKDFGYMIPVVGVVKDERHRQKKVIGIRTYTYRHGTDILLANSEAHRFALKYHRQLRHKRQ